MRRTRITVLGLFAMAAGACGIDAVGSLPRDDSPDASASSSSSSSGSRSSSSSGGEVDGGDLSDSSSTDAPADVTLETTPDGPTPTLVPPYLILTHSVPTTVNLTAEGTIEWAYWGVNGNTSSIRNAGAANVISALLSMGSSLGTGQGLGTTLTWSNGPTGSETGSYDWYRSANQTETSGRQSISAPSGPVKRIFTVIVGGTNVSGRLTAHLSDSSVPDKVDTTYSNLAGIITVRYVVEYATVGNASVELDWEPDVIASGAQIRFAAAALRLGP